MLDRRTPPTYRKISHIHLPEAENYRWSAGMPVHVIRAGSQSVVRLEFIGRHGSSHQQKPGQAYFTARMLSEGTRQYTAAQIAEAVDSVGAHIETSASLDFTTVTLYTLEKHLPKLVPIVSSILTEANFPEEEFTTLKAIKRQRLKIEESKNSVVATRTFRATLYPNHPYGNYLVAEDLDRLQVADLQEFYQNKLQHQFELFVAGSFSNDTLNLLERHFGHYAYAPAAYQFSELTHQPEPAQSFISKEGSLQSSLRIGKPLFTVRHPDYHRFSVLNTLFGGYFGSRLMKVIREDKGYTYGIYSSLNSMKNAGYFVIGADVVGEHTQAAIDEVYSQLQQLQQHEVSSTELETVQNYMVGTFLGSLNTPFAIADKYKNLYFNQLPLEFYTQHVQQIYSTTPAQIKAMANQYLAADSLSTIAVGCVPQPV